MLGLFSGQLLSESKICRPQLDGLETETGCPCATYTKHKQQKINDIRCVNFLIAKVFSQVFGYISFNMSVPGCPRGKGFSSGKDSNLPQTKYHLNVRFTARSPLCQGSVPFPHRFSNAPKQQRADHHRSGYHPAEQGVVFQHPALRLMYNQPGGGRGNTARYLRHR